MKWYWLLVLFLVPSVWADGFVVVGHGYGFPSPPRDDVSYDVFPSASLLLAVDSFEGERLFLLGDMVHKSNDLQFGLLERSVLSRFGGEVLAVPGNHENQNLSVFIEAFGSDGFFFNDSGVCFVGVNTGDSGFLMDDEDMYYLSSGFGDNCDRLFVFSHHLVWDTPLNAQEKRVNDDFVKRVVPLLEGSDKEIFWFSGDAKYPVMYRDLGYAEFFSSSLLGDENDNFLLVEYNETDVSVSVSYVVSGEVVGLRGSRVDYVKKWNSFYEGYSSVGGNHYWEWNRKGIVARSFDLLFEVLSSWMFWFGMMLGVVLLWLLNVGLAKKRVEK